MNAVAVGMQFYQQIEAVRTSGTWNWEQYVPGPLSDNDISIINKVAGCWCYSNGERVRFYTNQNHPDHGGRLFCLLMVVIPLKNLIQKVMGGLILF